jgi:hypothetical protein
MSVYGSAPATYEIGKNKIKRDEEDEEEDEEEEEEEVDIESLEQDQGVIVSEGAEDEEEQGKKKPTSNKKRNEEQDQEPEQDQEQEQEQEQDVCDYGDSNSTGVKHRRGRARGQESKKSKERGSEMKGGLFGTGSSMTAVNSKWDCNKRNSAPNWITNTVSLKSGLESKIDRHSTDLVLSFGNNANPYFPVVDAVPVVYKRKKGDPATIMEALFAGQIPMMMTNPTPMPSLENISKHRLTFSRVFNLTDVLNHKNGPISIHISRSDFFYMMTGSRDGHKLLKLPGFQQGIVLPLMIYTVKRKSGFPFAVKANLNTATYSNNFNVKHSLRCDKSWFPVMGTFSKKEANEALARTGRTHSTTSLHENKKVEDLIHQAMHEPQRSRSGQEYAELIHANSDENSTKHLYNASVDSVNKLEHRAFWTSDFHKDSKQLLSNSQNHLVSIELKPELQENVLEYTVIRRAAHEFKEDIKKKIKKTPTSAGSLSLERAFVEDTLRQVLTEINYNSIIMSWNQGFEMTFAPADGTNWAHAFGMGYAQQQEELPSLTKDKLELTVDVELVLWAI